MALTRVTFNNINSNIATITDPIVPLNYGNGQTNAQDIGFIFNRGDSPPNVAMVWDESEDKFQFVFTNDAGNTGDGNITSLGYANVIADVIQATYFVGNGSQLTGITADILLAGNLDGNISGNGYGMSNLAFVSVTGNVTANYFIGNGSQLTGITADVLLAGNLDGNLVGNGYGVDSLAFANIVGDLSVGGNVSFNDPLIYIGANNPSNAYDLGSYVSWNDGLANEYGGIARDATDGAWKVFANVFEQPNTVIDFANVVYANFQAGNLIVVANVVGGNLLTSGIASITGNVIAGNVNAPVGAVTAGNLIANSTVTAVQVSATGNINGLGGTFTTDVTALNFRATETITAVGSITGGNLITGGFVSATGNVNANNVNANNVFSTGVLSSTGNVVGGNVTTTGLISATGNITGGNLSGTNITGTLTTAAQPNITSVGTLSSLSVSGNVTGGNFLTSGIISAAGTVNTGNIVNSGTFDTGATSITGNLVVTGNINVAGNLNYEDVTDLSVGDPLIYIGANNTANLYDLGTVVSWDDGVFQYGGWVRDASDGTWKLFGNVTEQPTTTVNFANATYQPMLAGSISSTGTVTATGNISGGNINTAGVVSATGNVIGNTFVGNINSTSISSNTVIVSDTITFESATGNVFTANVANVTSNLYYRIPVTEKTANYTVTTTDEVILANGQITITLPVASTVPGKVVNVKRINQPVLINVSGNGVIDNNPNVQITLQYATLTVTAYGNKWWII